MDDLGHEIAAVELRSRMPLELEHAARGEPGDVAAPDEDLRVHAQLLEPPPGERLAVVVDETALLVLVDAAQQPETIEFYPPGTMAPDGAIAEVDPVSGRVMVRAPAIEQREIAEDSAVPTTAGLE